MKDAKLVDFFFRKRVLQDNTPEKELGVECETADNGHPGREAEANTDEGIAKQEGELTFQAKPQSAPVNYLKRARARKMARLEQERRMNVMSEKCPTDCFCGGCAPSGSFNADKDSS